MDIDKEILCAKHNRWHFWTLRLVVKLFVIVIPLRGFRQI